MDGQQANTDNPIGVDTGTQPQQQQPQISPAPINKNISEFQESSNGSKKPLLDSKNKKLLIIFAIVFVVLVAFMLVVALLSRR